MDEPWDDIDRLVQEGILDVNWPIASILDLGFGGAIGSVLSFYAIYQFGKYVGVDNLPIDGFDVCSSFTRYRQFEQEGGVRLPEIDQVQFDRIFTRVYDRDILEYVEGDRSQYEIVVLSSLLHLPGVKERWKAIIQHAVKLAKPEGYVYIKVFDEETGYGHFDSSEIAEMCSMMDVVRYDSGVGSLRQLRILGQPFADIIH